MRRLLALGFVAAMLLPSTASAYNIIYRNGNPIRVHSDPVDGISRLTWYDDPTEGANPLNLLTSHQSMQNAFDAWETVPCSSLDFTYGGPGLDSYRGYNQDGFTMISFEDPNNDLSGGVLAATATYDEPTTQVFNGLNFRNITGFDIVFGDGWTWIPYDTAIGGCVNQHVLESVALHEIGHGIGYAHSCESGEACPDPDELEAVMFWAIASCDTSKAFPKADDLALHNLVYGPDALTGFSADVTRGGVPMAVGFLLTTFADATNLQAVWEFGDGNGDTLNTDSASHTYTEEGLYSVSLELTGDSPTCGGSYTHSVLQRDHVLACSLSETSFSYSVNEKTVQFTGSATGQQIGCVDRLNWDFGDGGEAHTRSPVHEYSKDGTYQVSLVAEGPGGVSAAATQSVKIDTSGCNCALASGSRPLSSGALGLALALVACVFFRRKRNLC